MWAQVFLEPANLSLPTFLPLPQSLWSSYVGKEREGQRREVRTEARTPDNPRASPSGKGS